MATVGLTNELERACLLSPTPMGWAAALFTQRGVMRIAFGRETPRAALTSIAEQSPAGPWIEPGDAQERLMERLVAYLEGADDDFLDVALDVSSYTEFQQSVVRHCRRIPRGRTLSYGQLAAQAGSPRAARAVGNIMASNRFPLIVPCHRVVGGNSWGGYSGAHGLKTKLRLLHLEGTIDDLPEEAEET